MMSKEEEIIRKMRPGCICKSIKLYKIIQAIEEGSGTYEEIAKRTDIGGGSCNSKRCCEKVEKLLAVYRSSKSRKIKEMKNRKGQK